MRPQSSIILCNVGEYSYPTTDTYLFKSELSQKNFYLSRRTMEFINYSYQRKERAIKIECNVDDIYDSNYLFYDNGKKTFYCYILNKQYINDKTTLVTIKTDVIQTYMFNYEYQQSYVDRCHVDRWQKANSYPTREIEEEGLEIGDMMEVSKETIHTYKDQYLIVSSEPLGKINVKDSGGGGGGGGETCSPLVNNSAGSGWLIPSTGTVTALFGSYPSGGTHTGFDIGNKVGTPVLASKDGTVIVSKIQTDSYGRWIKIDHGNNIHSIYAHNSELLVAEGETVTRGQTIAKSGTTGNSTGVHCHWEVRKDNIAINPITVGDYVVGDIIEKTGCSGGGSGTGDYKGGPITNAGYTLSQENINYILVNARTYNILPSCLVTQCFIESHWGDTKSGREDLNWTGITMPFKVPADLGITVTQGTARPPSEGGYYARFNSMSDFFIGYTFVLSLRNKLYNVEGKKDIVSFTKGLFKVGGANADYASTGYNHYLSLMEPTWNYLKRTQKKQMDELDSLL